MKKYLFLLLIGAVSLTACGGDDDPVVPKLNELTRVSCYKDGASSPLFAADTNYTSGGKISNINSGVDRLLFIYSDDKFFVTDIHSGEVIEECTLNGNVITSKRISQRNPYASNGVYVSDEYSYHYSGSNWVLASWNARWPREFRTGYEERGYPKYEKCTWENGDVVLYAQSLDSREMGYECSVVRAPKNFPLRAISSFSPVDFGSAAPLGLLYDVQNRNLPIRTYTYTIPNQSEIKAKYKYTYTTVEDHVTDMVIDGNDGGIASSYKYTFEYNFAVK